MGILHEAGERNGQSLESIEAERQIFWKVVSSNSHQDISRIHDLHCTVGGFWDGHGNDERENLK